MSRQAQLLHLPTPGLPAPPNRRRRRPSSRWSMAGSGLLMLGIGSGLIYGLLRLPARLDTLLLVSKAIATVIQGVAELLLGILQLTAMLGVVLLALLALVLLAGGCLRLLRALTPGRQPHPNPKGRGPTRTGPTLVTATGPRPHRRHP